MEIMKALVAVLANPTHSPALQSIIQANPVRISLASNNSELAIRVDDRTGLKEHGQLDAQGVFTPL